MKLSQSCHALVVIDDHAEIIRVRKNKGGTFTVFTRKDVFELEDHQPELDFYPSYNGNTVLHVLQTSETPEGLHRPEAIFLPDAASMNAAIPSIKAEIEGARLSKGTKEFLAQIISPSHRVVAAYPFMSKATNAGDALRLAVKTLASFETTMFSAMGAKVAETIRTVTEPARPAAPAAAPGLDGVARRVQEAMAVRGQQKMDGSNATVADMMAAANAKAANVVAPEDMEAAAKKELKQLLAEVARKIGDIDTKLLDNGIIPAWRDTMNEVFDAANNAGRQLDNSVDDTPQPPRRRR